MRLPHVVQQGHDPIGEAHVRRANSNSVIPRPGRGENADQRPQGRPILARDPISQRPQLGRELRPSVKCARGVHRAVSRDNGRHLIQ